jgi:beta-N-acetylhexosaminidase
MQSLGRWWNDDPAAATAGARSIGFILANELRQVGVDFSFTPVLDLAWGNSSVIGDRAFHRDPDVVIALAGALIDGMRGAGMGCCGKHFPGHGWVAADSHVAIPVDERSLEQIAPDIRPYRLLPLDAVMPAHVIYPKIDPRPAGFSPVWLQYLRHDVGFGGVTFSDDLSMEGASVAGDILQRVDAAWSAGIDLLLICNSPEKIDVVLANWRPEIDVARMARIDAFVRGKNKKPANASSEADARVADLAAGHAAINLIAACYGKLT